MTTLLTCPAEVESSRTFLASRMSSGTQFEVLVLGLGGKVLCFGLGLKGCKSSKMPCPLLEDSTIFWLVENWPSHDEFCFVLKNARELAKKIFRAFFSQENPWIFRKIYEILERRPFFFGERLNFPENFRTVGAETFFLEIIFVLSPWSLALASRIPVLGLERVCPREGCPWY